MKKYMQKSNLIIISIVAIVCAIIPFILTMIMSVYSRPDLEGVLWLLIIGPVPNFFIGAILAAAILWLMHKAEISKLWVKLVVFLGATIASLPFAVSLLRMGLLWGSLGISFSYILLHPLIVLATFAGCYLLFILLARFFRIRWSFLICAVILPMIVAGSIYYVETRQSSYLPSDVAEQIDQIITSGDVESCKSLPLKWRQSCITPIAIGSKDFTLCENIFSPKARNACYTAYAKSTRDKQACDHVRACYSYSRKINRQICLESGP